MSGTVPSNTEIIYRALESRLCDVYTTLVARVDDYDRTSQTCSVTPVIREPHPKVDGTYAFEELPQIQNVPVLFPRSGPVAIVWDLEKNKHVLLLVAKYGFAGWRKSGKVSDGIDPRKHHLGSAIALPGIEPNSDPVSFAQEGKLIIEADDIRLGKNADKLVARADRVESQCNSIADDVNTIKSALNLISGHVHPSNGTPSPTLGALSSVPISYTSHLTDGVTGCDKVYGE